MVFYRTYRPQKISELDSESVRNSISTLATAKEIPHALLLTGSKGLGKTSVARIIAKIINCERRKGVEPCNRCTQCTSISEGTNLDVLEIDGASNRGIDEVRMLREGIKLSPAKSKKKVYIIDEVHMLTTEAFNALLKTLEEPPSHAMFLLCTTDPHKVPETITSRCFPIAFQRARMDELLRSLRRIVSSENIAIEKEALLEIVKASDGSFRDASKLLEQATLGRRKRKITRQIIRGLTGSTGNSLAVAPFLKEKNARGALLWLQRSVDKGLTIKTWLEDVLAHMHTALLSKYDVQTSEVSSELQSFSEDELKRLIVLFSDAHEQLRTAVIPQLPVELAIIEYCMGEKS